MNVIVVAVITNLKSCPEYLNEFLLMIHIVQINMQALVVVYLSQAKKTILSTSM